MEFRPVLCIATCFLAAWVGTSPVAAQTQYFEVLKYRDPTQCERMQCLSVRLDYCREHSKGFYLKEKGCPEGQICTDCVQGNGSNPTFCKCENPPYSVPVTYGQECNTGKSCTEGLCYRPCSTYLHITQCPSLHCAWNPVLSECVRKPPLMEPVIWTDTRVGLTVRQQGDSIVSRVAASMYPIQYADFWFSSQGYRIQGTLIDDVTKLESLFLQLDSNNDGGLSQAEFSHLPNILDQLNDAVTIQRANTAATTTVTTTVADTESRRLQQNQTVTPEICNAQRPRQFFCSFDESCKDDCSECGWKSARDTAFSMCVRPSREACWADGEKLYCSSDELCKPKSDCSDCVDRPIVDHSLHMCVALWWDPEPLPQWTNWVCRERNKVGMPCRHDQDCIYGLRRCLQGECQPYQPYNPNMTCEIDHDCPHLNYYCPDDPTGGLNPYWVKYCRQQRGEGMTCSADRECGPELRCNNGEPQPRCRRLFSLSIGTPSDRDILCSFAWRDRDSKCAVAAKSKEAGRTCDSDSDCVTTDATGRSGRCTCKAWWDKDDSKYCLPVAGDYEDYWKTLRDYEYFKASNCGTHWTEEQCLRVFGTEATALKLAVECETQRLSGGPYLPPSDCGISDNERFGDACAQLNALR